MTVPMVSVVERVDCILVSERFDGDGKKGKKDVWFEISYLYPIYSQDHLSIALVSSRVISVPGTDITNGLSRDHHAST